MSDFTIEDLFNYRRKGAGGLVDAYERQQQWIAELEYRAEEAEGKLSVVLDKQGQPDSYKCAIYDLTPLEAEKKVQDSIKRLGWLPPDEAAALRQERDELAATVELLREQLSVMAAQHQCGCGHPACNRCRDDADNREVLCRAKTKYPSVKDGE